MIHILRIENHIKDEGFNCLIDAILPISDSISEITLSRTIFKFKFKLENELSTESLTRIGSLIKEDKLRNLVILDLSCLACVS